jgi:hypothetical protein
MGRKEAIGISEIQNMRKDLEVPMDEFNRMSKQDQIESLCDYHECSSKKRKMHKEQYVHERWNPHPPKKFCDWWNSVGALDTEKKINRTWLGVDANRAFNCEAVREVYREGKEIGLVS